MSGISIRLDVVPTSKPVGAEIRGIDLSRELPEEAISQIRSALDDYGMVYFRGQHLTPQQQTTLSRRFGPLHKHVRQEYALAGYPEIHLISNIKENDRSIGSAYAGDDWHTDLCFMAEPLRYAMLHAIEVPTDSNGRILGDTHFASTAYAYDTLPQDLRDHIHGKHGIFQYQRAQAKKQQQRATDHARPDLTPEQKAATPDVTHPIVITHPTTGRKVIYVNKVYTFGIVDMADTDAQPLLQRLCDHIARPEHVHVHKWRAGDVIM